MFKTIQTDNAPAAIGPYSQAVQADNTVYISGQIPLDPTTLEIVGDDITSQAKQVCKNLSAITEAAGGSLKNIVKLTVFLQSIEDFAIVNEIMQDHFSEPYPARAAMAVQALPKNALIEIDAIMALG